MGSTAAALGAFADRQRAAEGHWFANEGQLAMMRHLEKMAQQGKVEQSAVEAARRSAEESARSGLPTEVINSRKEWVYEHKPGLVPAARWNDKRYMQMGTKISLGRARWAIDDASIFSVADGKRLASETPKLYSQYEAVRLSRVERAALESPTMAGYRLLPTFTPGRALFWGSVLALWGTGALIAASARSLDIHTSADVPDRLRPYFAPVAEALQQRLAPLRHSLSTTSAAADAAREGARDSELVKRLRTMML